MKNESEEVVKWNVALYSLLKVLFLTHRMKRYPVALGVHDQGPETKVLIFRYFGFWLDNITPGGLNFIQHNLQVGLAVQVN